MVARASEFAGRVEQEVVARQQAEEQVEQQRKRAEQAEAEVEQLKAKLREMGVDPDTVDI